MRRSLRFYCISMGILFLFVGIIGYVTFIAFTRRSGTTGMDIAEIQKVRHEHTLKFSNKILFWPRQK